MLKHRHRGPRIVLLVLPFLLAVPQGQHPSRTASTHSASDDWRPALSPGTPEAQAPVVQLRIYTINRGKLGEFVSAWKEGVYPLRRAHGYAIPAAWTIEETNQFVWIVTYDGPDWQAKEAAYYSSAGRRTLEPDPAQWIARAERWFMTPVIEHE